MAAAVGRGPHGHACLSPAAFDLFCARFVVQDVSALLSILGAIPEGETLSAEDVQALRRAGALMKGATSAIQAIEMQAACGGGGYVAARLKTVERLAMLSPAPLRRSKRPFRIKLDASGMCLPKRIPSPRLGQRPPPSPPKTGSLRLLRIHCLPDWPEIRALAAVGRPLRIHCFSTPVMHP